MNVDQLLDSLRSQGSIDSVGQFTISLETARKKLSHYQSSTEHRYLVNLVSASVCAGARFIDIRTTSRGFELKAPGASITREELQDASGYVAGGRGRSASAEIFIGTELLHRRGALEVSVRVTAQDGCRFLWRSTKERDTFESLPSAESPGAEFRITGLLSAPSWLHSLPSWLRGFRGYAELGEELRLVDRLCEYSPIPILVNGARIDRPFYLNSSPLTLSVEPPDSVVFPKGRRLEAGGYRWRGGLAYRAGTVVLVVDGVALSRLDDSPFQGILFADHLTRDLGREGIVDDYQVQQLRQDLELLELRSDLHLLVTGGTEGGASKDRDVVKVLSGLRRSRGLIDEDEVESFARWLEPTLPGGIAGEVIPPSDLALALPPSLGGLLDRVDSSGSVDDPRLANRLRLWRSAASSPRFHHQRKGEWLFAGYRDLLQGPLGGLTTWAGLTVAHAHRAHPSTLVALGYLYLGLGARWALAGKKGAAEALWMESLDAVRSSPYRRGEELIYAHLEHPPEHMVSQASVALELHLDALEKESLGESEEEPGCRTPGESGDRNR